MARLGRPRAKGPSTSGLTTEQDILVAAARLFCEVGYGSTSTYAIAQGAGISQASMYHYFEGKSAILLALLLETVEPSVGYATALADREEPSDVRLWALCAYDVRLLLGGQDNTGSLYLLPELGDEGFAPFHAERTRLFRVYRELVADLAGTDAAAAHEQASLVFGLVESVILRRRTEPELAADDVAPLIADAALRVLGVRETRLRTVRAQAARLAAGLAESPAV
jgi:AcrR family transcriptional regulator